MDIEKTISIIGCGWLGIPLGKQLLECCCFVKGSTQHAEKLPVLRGHGIEPFLLSLKPTLEGSNVDEFFSSEIAIILIPPSRKPDEVSAYPEIIQQLVHQIVKSPIEKVLFISATSVYLDLNREITEDDAGGDLPSVGQALLEAENHVRDAKDIQATVLRFSGLFGPGRHPGRFFSGKTGLKGGGNPVNFIHLEDCIHIICQLIKQDKWDITLNASADCHPTKKEFYTHAATLLNLDAPKFTDEQTTSFKIINSNHLKKALDYQFIYPDPLEALKSL